MLLLPFGPMLTLFVLRLFRAPFPPVNVKRCKPELHISNGSLEEKHDKKQHTKKWFGEKSWISENPFAAVA